MIALYNHSIRSLYSSFVISDKGFLNPVGNNLNPNSFSNSSKSFYVILQHPHLVAFDKFLYILFQNNSSYNLIHQCETDAQS